MKKTVFTLMLAMLAISCENKELKQATHTMKSADSLFKSANEGLRTLDSISAVVNDSAARNRVIIPEIEKTKRSAEEIIRKNAKSIDSLAGTVNRVKDQIQRGSDVLKTVDSTSRELQKDGDIFDKISTVTSAISKINKKSKKAAAKRDTVFQNEPNSTVQEPINDAPLDPMVKTARLKIYVDDIAQAKNQLIRELRNSGGEIVTESFGEEEGRKKEFITAKVPYRYFDETLSSISTAYGNVSTKNTESEGTEYSPDQMCDLEITFMENAAANDGLLANDSENSTQNSEAGDAFSKGFKNFGQILIWLLPFWPFLLIGLIIWYFVARGKRKKREAEILQMQQQIEAMKAQNVQRENRVVENPTQNPTFEKPQDPDPDDHSRFMPK